MLRRNVTLFLFIAVYSYFLLGGIGSYWLANHVDIPNYDFDYGVGLARPALYALLALACLVMAYGSMSMIRHKATLPIDPPGEHRSRRLTNIDLWSVTVLFGIGALGLILMIGQYGGKIPAFAEHADEFRTNVSSGLPQVLYFELILSTLIAYALLRRQLTSWPRKYLKAVLLTSLFLIFLGASRSMLITPILVMMIDLWLRKRLRWWQAAGGLAVAGATVFLIGLFRMNNELERGVYLLRFVADFAPEFREFAKLLTYIPDQTGFLHGQMFTNAALILLPGKIVGALGASKAEYWLPFGEYLKDLFNYQFAGGGLRAGLIAEYYANFGLPGVVVGFYGMGLLIRYLDVRVCRADVVARTIILAIALSVATSVLFTFDAIIYKVVSFGIGWALYRTIRFSLSAIGQPVVNTPTAYDLVEEEGA